MFKLVLGSRKR